MDRYQRLFQKGWYSQLQSEVLFQLSRISPFRHQILMASSFRREELALEAWPFRVTLHQHLTAFITSFFFRNYCSTVSIPEGYGSAETALKNTFSIFEEVSFMSLNCFSRGCSLIQSSTEWDCLDCSSSNRLWTCCLMSGRLSGSGPPINFLIPFTKCRYFSLSLCKRLAFYSIPLLSCYRQIQQRQSQAFLAWELSSSARWRWRSSSCSESRSLVRMLCRIRPTYLVCSCRTSSRFLPLSQNEQLWQLNSYSSLSYSLSTDQSCQGVGKFMALTSCSLACICRLTRSSLSLVSASSSSASLFLMRSSLKARYFSLLLSSRENSVRAYQRSTFLTSMSQFFRKRELWVQIVWT